MQTSTNMSEPGTDDVISYVQRVREFQLLLNCIRRQGLVFFLSAPINYSNHRKITNTKYSDEFQGTFGPPAPSAK